MRGPGRCVTAGWVLFPTNGPSFVERFHRLVAMVVGFMILGAAILAFYHNYDRYIRYPLGLAVLLPPVQILFGANTVLNLGVCASMAHQTAAQVVFAALLFSAPVPYFGPGPAREATTAPHSAPPGI